MSSFLPKIYGFLIVLLLLLSAIVLYRENINTKLSQKWVAIENSEILTNTVASTSDMASLPVTSSTSLFVSRSSVSSTTQEREAIDIPLERNLSDVKPPNACITPVTYTLGRFDGGFGISKNDFLKALADATALWNEALGKNIFSYSDNGTITINLIYDSRQASTERNRYIAAEINNTETVANALKVEFEAMEQVFTAQKDVYTLAVESFAIRQKAYNDTVNEWNQKGGAPKSEYDALILQKESLQKESESLLQKQNELNALLIEINKRITRYNELVLYANSNVARGNTLARTKFTEGQYIPQLNQIDIYQFSDSIKLHRVLAHEFGHVLGIDHTKNSESIMYGINNATSTILSKEDLEALFIACAQN